MLEKCTCTRRCNLIGAFIAGTFGILLLLIGIGGPFLFEYEMKNIIYHQVVVDSTDAPSYYMWQNNTASGDASLYMKYYIFNITNPEEVINGGIPEVKEFGPYTYREYWVYFNVSFDESGSEVTWNKWKYYVWDPEHSFPGANDSDIYTIANIPFQGVLGGLTYNSSFNSTWWKTLSFDLLASGLNSSLFIQMNVSGLFFGYVDPMFAVVAKPMNISPVMFITPNQTSIEESYRSVPFSVMQTGKKDIHNILNFVEWNNKTSIGCWASDEANLITGNDGTQFWPGITTEDMPLTWVEELFRTVQLAADGYQTVKGIKVIKFGIPSVGLQNASVYPINADYYQFGQPGVGNLTRCQMGAPIYMSNPHYLDAPWYQARVRGLDPDRSKHETQINVEPTIGTTLSARKRLQMNVLLLKEPLLYPNIRDDLFVPVVWIEESGELTDEQADQFKSQIYLIETIVEVVQWISVAIGLLLILVTIGVAVKIYKLPKKTEEPEYQIINE